MSINVYKFVKNFVCPFCNKSPNIHIPESEHITASRYDCPCSNTRLIQFPRSDTLEITYHESLEVRIHVDANESIFQLFNPQDNRNLLGLHNEILKFYERTTPQAAIIFLETLVTFQ